MEARIDHQATGAKAERLKIAELPKRVVLIGAQFIGKLFGIERPALGIGAERKQRAQQRQPVGIFALPDMAGNALMIGKGWQREARPDRGIAKIDKIVTWYRAVAGEALRLAVKRQTLIHI